MRALMLIVLGLLVCVGTFGEAAAGKKQITVLRLATAGRPVPDQAVAEANRRIEDVFLNVGSYKVAEMAHAIESDEVTTFMDRLRELRQSSAPAGSLEIGSQTFRTADLERLAASFVIVVPALTSYSLRYEAPTGYTVQLEASFTVIAAASVSAIAHFAVPAIGVGDSPDSAASEALRAVAGQLVYDLHDVPSLEPVSDVVEVGGSTVLIERGRTAGVRLGDEFAVVTRRVLPTGRIVDERIGLIVVTEVRTDLSYGRLVYSTRPVGIGDRIAKIRRLGFQSTFYVHSALASTFLGSVHSPVFLFGSREALTRGFPAFRPVIGLEVPVAVTAIGGSASYGTGPLPYNLYFGGELNWRLRRFDLVPLAAIGFGGMIGSSSRQGGALSLFGGQAQVSLGYFMSPRLRIFVDAGYTEWLSLSLVGWGGFYGGVGIAVSY